MERYWIWLSLIKYVGPVLQKNLLGYFGCPRKVFEAAGKELAEVPTMNKRALQSLLNSKTLTYAENILQNCREKEIQILQFDDERYPPHAKSCPESPVVLFYKGTLEPITEAVAVVGSRRCTSYGKKMAQEMGRQLAEYGVPLISGFAKGIDSYAQSACVNKGGYTIAFLAGGVDLCYPAEQRPLYEKILESGSVFISSQPPGTKARPEYFLQRNAFISAWSREVVVVEATAKSGALWTAQYAQSHGRSLFAVPHPIGMAEGEGTNRLIAEGKAELFMGIESLDSIKKQSRVLTLNQSPNRMSAHPLTKIQHKIISYLTDDAPTSLLELSRHLQVSEETILEELLTLELNGIIILRGNLVTRV